MKKLLAVGVIVLFLGMTISSTTGIYLKEQSIKPLSFGNTLYVGGNGSGNYTRIQDAINDAGNGDTVYVYSGFYVEIIRIEKSIKLIGEDKYNTIIDSNDTFIKSTITIKNDSVTVSEFTIQNASTYGINIYSSYNRISDNIITNNNFGIHIYGDFKVLKDNLIVNNTITNNNRAGMELNYWNTNTTISHNTIQNNPEGIAMFSSNNNISYNTFKNNEEAAISMWHYTNHNTISHNIIQESLDGLFLLNTEQNIIEKNLIINNKRGISISGFYSNLNKINNNNIYQNKRNAFFLGSRLNLWNGNYWGESRNTPKPIFGLRSIPIFRWSDGHDVYWFHIYCPWFQFDFSPAKEPYDIGV